MSQKFPVDNEALEAFALRLLRARSYSTEEANAAAVLHEELTRRGFDVTVDELGNVIGTLRLGDGPVVLLDAHLDTVGVLDPSGWSRRPDGEVADGRMFGRGAVDIKGPMAACVHGVSALRSLDAGTVVISGTVAEELLEGPALLRVLETVKPDFVVICEPSSGTLARGQRGRAEVLVEVAGRSCHSAYPESGINAAEVMVDVITALRAFAPPQQPTLGAGILVLTDVKSHPYPGLSVVPERCAATFDRRTLVGETEAGVLAPIRDIVDEVVHRWGTTGSVTVAEKAYVTYTGMHVQAQSFAPAWLADADAPVVVAAVSGLIGAGLDATRTHYKFCTNGSASAGQLGIPTIGYGPGHEDAAHTVDESISLVDLRDGAQGYAAIVASLLAQGWSR
jgi:putative selenium metabolism hydrolase